MKELQKLVRKNILSLAPYSSARNEYSGKEATVFLDANENPYNQPYNRYPDPLQRDIKAKIADIKGVDIDSIFLGNGSDEAIDLVYRCFTEPRIDNVVAIAPTYGMYQVCADINDVEYRSVLLNEHFDIDADSLLRACDANTKVIWLCSPNNPTGAVATKEQLQQLVDFAKKNGCIIIFDSAYSAFIRDENLPKTIFQIEGAKECALEINSFSKPAGFTGVRLGWSIVPKALKFADGTPVQALWSRLINTFFNGASNIAQAGGLAALDPEGVQEMRQLTDFYLENAALIKKALEGENFRVAGVEVYGQGNAPYLWVRFPGKKSWDMFDKILDECHVVTTPGAGFGPAGESFIRFSSFGHREAVEEACRRLANLKL